MSISEKEKKELAVVKSQTTKAFQVVENLQIKNSKELEVAKKILVNLGTLKKFILEKKNKLIVPAKAIIDEAKKLYQPFEEKITEADGIVRQKMLDYNDILKAEEDKSRTNLENIASQKNGSETKIEKAVAKTEAIVEKREAIPTRKIRDIEIVDESQIPERYWVLDRVAIRKDAVDNSIAIPGIKVVEKEIIVNSIK
jgi:hypothetical protein